MGKYAIIENGTVVNIVKASPETAAAQGWVDAAGLRIGDTWDGEQFHSPPPPAPPPGMLTTDKWSIYPDSIDTATVTYTTAEPVYFGVDDETILVEPLDGVATLEIVADAPGPIRVNVRNKWLLLASKSPEGI